MIPFVGLVAYLVKLDARLKKIEESSAEADKAITAHLADTKIHLDPVRDSERLKRIEGDLHDLNTKLDTLLKFMYSGQK